VSSRVSVFAAALFVAEERTADRRFGFGLTAGGAGATVDVLRLGPLDLAVSAALLPGAIHAVVYDLTPTEPGARFWLGATGVARARVRVLPSTFVEIAGGATLSLVRYDFATTGTAGETVFRGVPVAPVAFLGIGRTFP